MKNILVTGASSGVGYQLVKKSILQGDNVVAIARSEDKLNQLRNELDTPDNLFIFSLDLTDRTTLSRLEPLLRKWKHIDALINNAGLLINKPLEELELNEIQLMLNINFLAPVQLTKLCLPFLKQAKENAHIVNISTMGAVQGSSKFSGLSGYSSSKAALTTWTECLAVELKDTNVKSNALALGAVQTEMLEKAFPGYVAPLNAEQMSEYIYNFAISGHKFQNGKIISLALTTP